MSLPILRHDDVSYPRREADVYWQRFSVPFEYPVAFTCDVFSRRNPVLLEVLTRFEPSRRHRLSVVIDDGVAGAWPGLTEAIARYVDGCPDHLELAGEPLIRAGGESAKNDAQAVTRLQAHFLGQGLDRQAIVMAIGGGALLDLVGYAAATTHRGLRLVRVPTTVLGQNDSGVGVKNGVNAFGVKNLIGTFAPPFAVINDLRFLETLEPRDRVAGMAEAVKVALVRDAGFFDWMEAEAPSLAAFQAEAVELLVRRCAHLHLRHIGTSGDPFETGSARPLDFGHWAAHRLEALTAHRLRHGEAVAIGMALDARYSVEAGLLAPASLERICRLLEGLGLRLWDEVLDGPEGRLAVLTGLEEFRQHLGGELTVTLLRGIGHGVEVGDMSRDGVLRALAWLQERAGPR